MIAHSPTRRAAVPSAEIEARVLQLARGLAVEVHPSLRPTLRISTNSSLDRDLGLDSLGRVELLTRVEREFGVELPADTLVRATTPGALARAVETAHPAQARGRARAAPSVERPPEVPDAARTMVEVLRWHVDHHPDATHLVLEDAEPVTLSYRALHEAALRVAAGLRARGVHPGEPVALMLPTGRAFFEAFVGAWYAGAIPVPLYPPTSLERLGEHVARQSAILANAEARLLITDEAARLETGLLRARAPVLRHVETVERLARDAPAGEPGPVQPGDLALLQYTSGSTGAPKGVMLSHANLLANVRAMGRAVQVTPRDVFVSWLPLYHDMGLIGAWMGSLVHGLTAVILPPQRFLARPEAWLWAIHAHRGTLTASPNFAWELCLSKVADEQVAGLDLSSLRLCLNGAEPVNAATVERFAARFAKHGLRREALTPVYGLAEASVGLAFPPPGRGPWVDHVSRDALLSRGEAVPVPPDAVGALHLVACGRPLAGHALRIVDALGREAAERHEGRIQFQGPSATRGYWRNPEQTRRLFDGPWLDTGDTGYLAQGELFPTGRVKDLIIRAGQHVHPHELEAAAGGVPGVRRGCVAVFGVPDVRTHTERVVVVAEARATELERADLARRILDAVTPVMGEPPDDVVVAAPHAVPKTPSGKIRRTACRDLYLRGALSAPAKPRRGLGARLAAGLIGSAARRVVSAAATLAWAAWFWLVIGLTFLLGWPAVLVTPGAARKRAVLRTVARAALALLGTRLEVHGAEHLQEAHLVAINHSSYLDGLVAAAVLPPRFRFTVKSELASQAVAGPFLRGVEALFIERDAVEAAPRVTADLEAALRAGACLTLFPEGTLRRAPGLMPFHLGGFVAAARAGVSVVPVTFVGTRTALRGDQWFPRRAHVVVRAFPPVAPAGGGWEDALRLRNGVRAAMLPSLGEPDLATE